MLREYKKNFKLGITNVTTEEIKPVQIVELPEIDEKDYIEIEVEQTTLEDYIKYQEYKKARNERVKEKFGGGKIK